MADEPLVAPKLPDSIDMATMVISIVGAAVPVPGGSLAEVANRCLKANHEAAMDDFHSAVAERINRLADDQDLRQRLADPDVTEMLIRTVRVAEATSQHEKRLWLANAVVNCLRADSADNLDRLRNLRLIDQLMPVHVHVLRFLSDPEPSLIEWGTRLPTEPDSSNGSALAQAIPDMPNDVYATSVLTDLQEMELISRTSRRNYAAIFEGGAEEPYRLPELLPRASSLLSFIAEPEVADWGRGGPKG